MNKMRMRINFPYLSVAGALVICTWYSPVKGQDTTTNREARLSWLNLGPGLNSYGYLSIDPIDDLFGGSNLFGGSVGASISYYQPGKNLVSIRLLRNKEINWFVSPLESIWDFGGLYGLIYKSPKISSSMSGGIALVGGGRRGKLLSTNGYFDSRYETDLFMTIGLPVEFTLFWTPRPAFGIGLYGFGNINPERSFFGALLSLQLAVQPGY